MYTFVSLLFCIYMVGCNQWAPEDSWEKLAALLDPTGLFRQFPLVVADSGLFSLLR